MRTFPAGLVAALAVLSYGLAVVIDVFVLDRPLLGEGPPSFEPVYWLRTSLVALGSACAIAAIVVRGGGPDDSLARHWRSSWDDWGTIRWVPHLQRPDSATSSVAVKSLVAAAAALVSAGFAILFVVNPTLFSSLGREGEPVELLSAVFLFVSCGIFARVALRARGGAGSRAAMALPAAGLALVFFLVAMEEISWFQHVLGFETPEIFAGNGQGETNLHNYATTASENAYYLAAFGLLVMLPFLLDHGFGRGRAEFVDPLGPSHLGLLTGALFVAFNYDMWNGLLTQGAFFLTLFILLSCAVTAWRTPERWLVLLVVGVFLFSQLAFLYFGSQFVRLWDVTEYKEFLIPMGILLYALEVRARPGAQPAPPGAEAAGEGEIGRETPVIAFDDIGVRGVEELALSPVLRHRLRLVAEKEGVSVDQFIASAVAAKISTSTEG